jgi:hypothetical protein
MRKSDWRRPVILAGALSALLANAGARAQSGGVAEPVEYFVTVYNPGGVKPGVPILILVKDRDGRVVAESKTDAAGAARFRLTATSVASAVTLEALLDLGAGRLVGAIETLNRDCNAYEVFLPEVRLMQCHGTTVKAP